MLEINNFSKFYGDKKVVDNLSILVQPGDILWIHWCKWSWKNYNNKSSSWDS